MSDEINNEEDVIETDESTAPVDTGSDNDIPETNTPVIDGDELDNEDIPPTTEESNPSEEENTDIPTITGEIIIGKYIPVPKDPTKSLVQLAFNKTWVKTVDNDEMSLENLASTHLYDFFKDTSLGLTEAIPEVSTELSEDEKTYIRMVVDKNISDFTSNCNSRGILNPEIVYDTKAYDRCLVSDMNSSNSIILIYPESVYERLFGAIDYVDPNEVLDDEFYYGLNVEPTEEIVEEPITEFDYRLITLNNTDGINSAEILSLKHIDDGIQLNISQIRENITDIVKIYTVNWSVIEAKRTEITDVIAQLIAAQESYINTKNTLESELNDKTSRVSELETLIRDFEESHQTQVEGDLYFDRTLLDSEDSEEYDNLINESQECSTRIIEIDNAILENESNNKSEEIVAKNNELGSFNNMINSYEIGTLIPMEYLSTIELSSTEPIPKNCYIYITEGTIEEVERDFSDTEIDNVPYYYFTGRFTNSEISGTTTRCIMLTSVNKYDERKSFTNLKTYHPFNRIFLTSNVIKSFINSLRNQDNNELTEDAINSLINNPEVYIPMGDVSELAINDEESLIPSLSILIEDMSGEEPDDDDPSIDVPDDEPEEVVNENIYLRGGKLEIINGIIFSIPDNSDAVKRIVYVNGFYYILMNNCFIYKLDNDFDIVTVIDLGKLSTDISKTDIFSIGNMLIIQSDKTYVTDLESIKMNMGLADTDVMIDSVKVNTKTIVKITLK